MTIPSQHPAAALGLAKPGNLDLGAGALLVVLVVLSLVVLIGHGAGVT